jgi:predicted AlkP superfamily pyrophosphatase or phosphodiesterase
MFRRVVVVLADGLRPDVITPDTMPVLHLLGENFYRAVSARTIDPPRTVAALTSLTTGISPARHKLFEPGLGIISKGRDLRPLPRVLRAAGMRTAVVAGDLPAAARPVARALAMAGGIDEIDFVGDNARLTAIAAGAATSRLQDGLLFVYMPDCDRAGHAHGWMTGPYLEKAVDVDAAIGSIARTLDGETLLIVLADHGGGGVEPKDHAQPHPLNEQIPLIIAGKQVCAETTPALEVSILDVPATILWALDVDVPDEYEGRVLLEAFAVEGVAVA